MDTKTQATRVLIFTDLHFGGRTENKDKEGINTHGDIIRPDLIKLKEIILQENPDFVMNLGDTINYCSKEEFVDRYKEFLEIFSNLPMPVHHIHGNHDLKILAESELNGLVQQKDKVSFTYKNIHHIILKAYKANGAISVDYETLEWLQEEIKNTPHKVVIYCHYPISEDKDNLGYYHIYRAHDAFVQQSKMLRELFEQSGKILCVLSGHTHFYYNKTINGIKYVTIPSFSEDKDKQPSTEFGILEIPSTELRIQSIR